MNKPEWLEGWMSDANNAVFSSNTLEESKRQQAITLLERGEPLPIDLLCWLLPKEQSNAVLIYPDKRERDEILQYIHPAILKPINSFGELQGSTWSNMLIQGDNLPLLKTLMEMRQQGELKNADGADGIRLIYIDPPFATGQTFRDSQGNTAYEDKVKAACYIEFLRERLILAYELLAESGTIYIHLDPRMSSYIRVVMDEIFGTENFLNEISWVYRGREASRSHWNQKHDTILVYARCRGKHIFNWSAVVEKYAPITLTKFRYEDEKGLFQIRGRAQKGSPVNQADGLALEDETKYPGLTYRQYLGEGVLPRDWFDIPPVNKAAREKTGYPTQKPEALLARVIAASSNPGDIVLDFFAGSGTTLAVAEKLDRCWIGIDQSDMAIETIVKRLSCLRSQTGNKGEPLKLCPFVVFTADLL
jgi:DNA modification methylase